MNILPRWSREATGSEGKIQLSSGMAPAVPGTYLEALNSDWEGGEEDEPQTVTELLRELPMDEKPPPGSTFYTPGMRFWCGLREAGLGPRGVGI